MPQLHTAHTSALDSATLSATRTLLAEVFGEDFTDHDWENALGGVHALIWEDNELIGHASVVQRRFLHRGRALRTGYLESVGVRADHRGRGHGAAMMTSLERVLRRAYDLGALSSTDEAKTFYASRGWDAWSGPLSALTPNGIEMAASDREVYVFRHAVPIDLLDQLTCDWRNGDLW